MTAVVGLKIRHRAPTRARSVSRETVLSANRREYDRRRRLSARSSETLRYMDLLRHDPCCFCGARRFQDVDHIVPLLSGGDDDWSNMTAACPPCNRGRRNRDLLSHLLGRG